MKCKLSVTKFKDNLLFSVAGHYRAAPTEALIHNASKHCITLTTDNIRRMLVKDGSKIKITVSHSYKIFLPYLPTFLFQM